MPTTLELSREDVEAVLKENHFKQGKFHEDPEQDASYIWYAADNSSYVMFKDEGVVYGGVDAMEAGIALTYDRVIAVMAGILAPAKAGFTVPAGIFERLRQPGLDIDIPEQVLAKLLPAAIERHLPSTTEDDADGDGDENGDEDGEDADVPRLPSKSP